MEQYPRDEFDELAQSRQVRGAHRKKRNPWRIAIPFLSVLVLAPLAGWGLVELWSQDGMTNPFIEKTTEATDEKTPEETQEETTTDEEATTVPGDEEATEDTTDPADETGDDEAPSEEPTEEETEAIETLPPVDGVAYDSSVLVYNGTGIPGGADQAVEALRLAGYTNITVEDYAAANPATTALYFANNDLYTTAQNVSQTLAIDYWAESGGMTGANDLLIVIR